MWIYMYIGISLYTYVYIYLCVYIYIYVTDLRRIYCTYTPTPEIVHTVYKYKMATSLCVCLSPEGWTDCFWMSAAVTLKDAISSFIYFSPSRLYQDKL